MMLRGNQPNFSKGVLAEELLGRVDVAAYNAGLKRGENIVLRRQGAFSIRPGFRFTGFCIAPGERFLPFQFSDEQPYALAFGQEYMQPLTGGGVVVEEELLITGATNTSPMVLEAANHGYAAGEQVILSGVEGPLGRFLNGRVWTVVGSLDADHFSIDLDGSNLPAFTSATGGIERADPPPPPPPVPPTPPPYVPPPAPPVFPGGFGNFSGGDVESYRPGVVSGNDLVYIP